MKLKEIARAFDMNISQFADCIGYTRQAFYCKADNHSTNRAKAATKLLEYRNHQILDEEIQAAKARFEKRMEAIEAFEKMFVKGGDGK